MGPPCSGVQPPAGVAPLPTRTLACYQDPPFPFPSSPSLLFLSAYTYIHMCTTHTQMHHPSTRLPPQPAHSFSRRLPPTSLLLCAVQPQRFWPDNQLLLLARAAEAAAAPPYARHAPAAAALDS